MVDGSLRHSFHIPNFEIFPVNGLEVRVSNVPAFSIEPMQWRGIGNSMCSNFQIICRINLQIGDAKATPQKTHIPCEHLSKQFGTNTFPYMASSDDVTNGESHSNFVVLELGSIQSDFDESGTNGLHLNQIMGKCLGPLISRHRPHFELA